MRRQGERSNPHQPLTSNDLQLCGSSVVHGYKSQCLFTPLHFCLDDSLLQPCSRDVLLFLSSKQIGGRRNEKEEEKEV